MKSSTVRRSALSRESMDIIENLANETPSDYDNQYSNSNDYAPSEYYRETNENVSNNKSKEIDLLWQSFKSAQFNTNSPFMHFLGGFILGVIVTALTISLFGMFAANSGSTTVKNKLPWFGTKSQVQQLEDADMENADNIGEEQNIPSDEIEAPVAEVKNTKNSKKQDKEISNEVQTPMKTKKYIIKDGDTVEAIIKRNYGSYTPERAEAIMKANNLKDLDHISIDQELLLPVEP